MRSDVVYVCSRAHRKFFHVLDWMRRICNLDQLREGLQGLSEGLCKLLIQICYENLIFVLDKGCQKMDNAYQELEACSAAIPYPAGY